MATGIALGALVYSPTLFVLAFMMRRKRINLALFWATLSLSATPFSVRVGGIITLSWLSTDANSCTASGDWSGSKATTGGSESMSISNSSTFTLTCTGDGGSAISSVSYEKRDRRWLDFQ